MVDYNNLFRACLVVVSNIAGALNYQLANANENYAKVRTIEEVVVVAQKREQNIQDVPIAISAYSEEKIFQQNIVSTMDLARVEPSLNFQQGFSDFNSNFSIRGIGAMSFEGGVQPSVSVVVDGVPLIRVGEFQGDMGDLQSIEVLKGPQGTLFGKNATGGAINVVRNPPSKELEAYVEFLTTDDKEDTARLMFNSPLSDKVAFRILGFIRDQKGFIENVFPGVEDDGTKRNLSFVAKLGIDINDSMEMILTVDKFRTRAFGSAFQATTVINPNLRAALGDDVINDDFKINQDRPNVTDSDTFSMTLQFDWDISDSLALTSISSSRNFENRVGVDIDASPARPSERFDLNLINFARSNYNPNPESDPPNKFYTEYLNQEVRLSYSHDRVTWVNGIFIQTIEDGNSNETPLLLKDSFALKTYFGIDVPSTSLYIAFTNPFVSRVDLDSYAVFSDLTYSFSEKVTVYGGVRWTWEESSFDYHRREIGVPAIAPFFIAGDEKGIFNVEAYETSAALPLDVVGVLSQILPLNRDIYIDEETSVDDWSGRLGLQYYINEDANLYFNVGRSFIGSGFNISRDANPDNAVLAPTVSQSVEVGFKSIGFDRRVRFNSSLFYQTATDLQTSRIVPNTVFTETINGGDINSYGADFSLQWQINDWLGADIAYAYVHAELDNLVQACYHEQSIAEGCSIDTDNDGLADSQDLSGRVAPLTPEQSYSAGLRIDPDYIVFNSRIYAGITYSYQGEVQFSLLNDPLTVQEGYGLLDANIGIAQIDGKFDASIFGVNLLDQGYLVNKSAMPNLVGRVFSNTPRSAKTYYGMKFKYNF